MSYPDGERSTFIDEYMMEVLNERYRLLKVCRHDGRMGAGGVQQPAANGGE